MEFLKELIHQRLYMSVCTQLTIKLFSNNVPSKVQIHFYHTSDKVQVQGSPMIQGMSSVVWLVEYLRKKDINTEILPDTGSKCRYNLKESVRLLLKKLESPAPAPSIIINNNNGLPSPHQPLLSHQYSQTDSPD